MQATAAYVLLVHVLLALAVAFGNASNASPQPAAVASSTATPEGERVASVNLQDNFGCTALMHASIRGRALTVQLMLDAKADASLQSIDGSTALMLAEYHNHTAAAQVLRQHAKRSTATAEARAAAVAAELLAEEAEDKDLSGACGTGTTMLSSPPPSSPPPQTPPSPMPPPSPPPPPPPPSSPLLPSPPSPPPYPCTLNMCGHCEMPAVADAESWPIRCV